jgi:sigma-B regulation protein RsbU (phosphoserine phosphatase)
MVKTRKSVQIDDKIYQITTLVAGDFKLNEVLDKLAKAAVEATGTEACSIRLLDEEADDLKMCSSYGLSQEYRNKGVVSKNDAVIRAAFAGEAIVINDMRIEKIVKYKEAARKEGLVSQLTVVMRFKSKPIGVLRLYRKKLMPFEAGDVTLARLVASQCATAITNARLYSEAIEGARIAEQMKFAGDIQRRMIPEEAPKIPGLDIAGIYQPCFEVGGDLYDFIKLDDQNLLVVIADVIGKGIPAAIMMSMFRGTIRAYSHGGLKRHSLVEIIQDLNKIACAECRDGEFITLFIAYINVEDMTIKYCNCGHEPALLFRNNNVIELADGGLVLGVLPDTEYVATDLKLHKKDLVLCYTDGLIDAVNFEGETWGKDNMVDVAKQFTQHSSETFIKNILAYRRRFVGLARQIDDTSMVAVKIKNDNEVLKPKSKTKLKAIEKAIKKKNKQYQKTTGE